MGMISDIFADVANKGVPVMSVGAMKTLPNGILSMLNSTDMIVTADDLARMAQQQSTANTPSAPPVILPEEQANMEMLGAFASDVMNGVASASTFTDVDGSRDVCAVSASDAGRVRMLGGRPLEIIPGHELDWNALTYLHEDAHCEDFKDGGFASSGIQREIYADSDAFRDYYKGYKNGVVSDPEVPYAWRAQRAIGVMEQGDYGEAGPEEHSVNAITPLPGEKYAGAQHTSNHAAGQAMLQAREQIINEIGSDLVTLSDAKKLQVMQGLAYGDPSMDPALKQQIFMANIEAATNPNGKFDAVGQIESQMSPESRIAYDQYVSQWEKTEQRTAAETAIAEQPGLMYETSKRMLQTGKFDNNPAGKQFVENYVDGVERYDPTRHGVAPEDRPTERPAIVDQLAQQYAPRPEPVLQNGYAR